MKSYKAEELFDENGRLIPELAELAPKGNRRMGSNPHANGGLLLRDLRHAGLSRPRGKCAFTRRRGWTGYDGAGQVPARRRQIERA